MRRDSPCEERSSLTCEMTNEAGARRERDGSRKMDGLVFPLCTMCSVCHRF